VAVEVHSISELAYRVQGKLAELNEVRSWLNQVLEGRFYMSSSHLATGVGEQHAVWVYFYVRETSALFKLAWV
jgi:hypothetical protein